MTGTEIKQAAESYIEDYIDDPDALIFINRVLNMIGDMALIYEAETVTAEETQAWHSLPPTLTNIRKVETAPGVPYYGYEQMDGLIRFADPGTYMVHYRRLPNSLSGIAGSPEVHPAFHSALVTGLIALWKLKDDDENPDGIRHYQEFKEQTLRVYGTLQRARTPNRVTVIR